MANAWIGPNIWVMGTTYAVSWKEAGGPTDSGRLELGPHRLRLEGAGTLDVVYDDLLDISIGRDAGDRLAGRATVVLVRRGGRSLWIAPVAHHAVLLELFDRLSGLRQLSSTS